MPVNPRAQRTATTSAQPSAKGVAAARRPAAVANPPVGLKPASPPSVPRRPACSAGQTAWREAVAMCLALAVILLVIKARLLPFEATTVGEAVRWLARLAVVSADDMLLVGILAGICRVATAALGRWPRLTTAWRVVQSALFLSMAAYSVFAMALFRVTMQPFNIRMMTLVEGPMTMIDSIKRYLTWYWVGGLAAAPLAVALAPWLLRRATWFRSGAPMGWKACGAAAILLAGYVVASSRYVEARWTEPGRWERRIACNPQLAFLASCAEEFLIKEESWTVVYHGEANEQDFVSRQRPAGQESFNLEGFQLSPRPKNVVVFFLESIGAEYLSLYGAKHQTTPHLEKLVADRGVVFENLYVTVPYSCKSIVALSSSVYERLDWKLAVMDSPEFAVPTITEVLHKQGYRTCYAHSGYWSWRNRDRFFQGRVGTLLDAEQMPEQKINSWGVKDQAMFQATLDWIDADPGKPFFLLAYTIETHHPYCVPAEPMKFDVADEEEQAYLNAIRATDEYIAWYVKELEKRRLLDDTLIVITADHGEAFGQHNQRSHNFGVYEPNVHIPLVMLHPSLKKLPRRVEVPREQIDLAPTVLDMLGYKSPGVWQGRNLFRPDDGRPAYFYCVGNFVVLGLRDGAYKYHFYVDSGQEELFDVKADPREEKNIAAAHPDRCRDYQRRVGGLARFQRAFLAEHGSP
jgi:arylsulfatase A-like enzyme